VIIGMTVMLDGKVWVVVVCGSAGICIELDSRREDMEGNQCFCFVVLTRST
jgi:hypothetical protein